MPRAGGSWTPTLGLRPGLTSSNFFRYPGISYRSGISPLRFGLGGLGQGLTLSPEAPALGLAGIAAPVGRGGGPRGASYGVAGGVAGGRAGGRAGVGAEGSANYVMNVRPLPDGRRLVTYGDGSQVILPPAGRTGAGRPIAAESPEGQQLLASMGMIGRGVGVAQQLARLVGDGGETHDIPGPTRDSHVLAPPSTGGVEGAGAGGGPPLIGAMSPEQIAALGELGINTDIAYPQAMTLSPMQPGAGFGVLAPSGPRVTGNVPQTLAPGGMQLDQAFLDSFTGGGAGKPALVPEFGPQIPPQVDPITGIPYTGFGETSGAGKPGFLGPEPGQDLTLSPAFYAPGGPSAETILGDAARQGMYGLQLRPEDIMEMLPAPSIQPGSRVLDPRGMGATPEIFTPENPPTVGPDLNVTPSNVLGLGQNVLGAAQGGLSGDYLGLIRGLLQSGRSLADIGQIPGIARYLSAAGAPVNLVQAVMQGNMPGVAAAAPGLINTFATMAPQSFAQTAQALGLTPSQLGALGGVGGVIGGGYGLYNAIQKGDPLGMTMNAAQLYSAGAPLVNSLTGTTLPTLGNLGSQALSYVAPEVAASLGLGVGQAGVGALGSLGAAAPELLSAAAPAVGEALMGGTVAGLGTTAAAGGGAVGGAGIGASAAGLGAGLTAGIVAAPLAIGYLGGSIGEMLKAEREMRRARARQQRFERGLPTMRQDLASSTALLSQLTPQTSDEDLLRIYAALNTLGKNWEGGPATGNPNAPSFPSMLIDQGEAGRATAESLAPYLSQIGLGRLRAEDLMAQRGLAIPGGGLYTDPTAAAMLLGGGWSAYDPESGSSLAQSVYRSNNPWIQKNLIEPSTAEYQRQQAQYEELAARAKETFGADWESAAADWFRQQYPHPTGGYDYNTWSPEAQAAFKGIQPGGMEAGIRQLLGLPAATYGGMMPVGTERYGTLTIPTFNTAIAPTVPAQPAAPTTTAFNPLGFLSALQGGQKVNIQAGPETLTFIPYKPEQAGTYAAKDSGYQQIGEGYYVKPSGQQGLEVYVPQNTTQEALGKALSGSTGASQQALAAALAAQAVPAGQESGATPGTGPATDIAPEAVPAGTAASTPTGSTSGTTPADATQPLPGAGFKKGGVVPKTGEYLVHKGEVVIPADKADTEAESEGFLDEMRQKGELKLGGEENRRLEMPKAGPGRLDRGFGPGPDGGSQPDDEAKIPAAPKWYVHMRDGVPTQDLDGTDPNVRRLAFTPEDVRDALDAGEAPVLVGKAVLAAPPSLQRQIISNAQKAQFADPMKNPAVIRMAADFKDQGVKPEGDTVPYPGLGEQILRGNRPRFSGDRGRGADIPLDRVPQEPSYKGPNEASEGGRVRVPGTMDRMPQIQTAPPLGNPFMVRPAFARAMRVAQNAGQVQPIDRMLQDIDRGVAAPGTLREAIGTQKRYLTPQDIMNRPGGQPQPGLAPATQPGLLEQALRRITG